MPAIEPMPAHPANPIRNARAPRNDDGTTQLLRWGAIVFAVGLVAAFLAKTLFGGIGPQGPHTNSGWLALIVTMMCLPFGCMAFLLGAAKWLRNRRHPPER